MWSGWWNAGAGYLQSAEPKGCASLVNAARERDVEDGRSENADRVLNAAKPERSARVIGPMSITLPSMKELFTGDLAVNGNWVVANLETGIPWPSKVVKVTFRGNALFLLPPTSTPLPSGPSNETYPAIAVNLGPGKKFDDGMLIISHHLSSLAWVERHGARVEHWSVAIFLVRWEEGHGIQPTRRNSIDLICPTPPSSALVGHSHSIEKD